MIVPGDPNLRLVEHVAASMGADLRREVVFVGGAVVGLLTTDPARPMARPTDDVDVLIEVVSRRQYNELEGILREKHGFQHDVSPDAPICRWLVDGVKVDVMPTDPAPLGFTNRWYPLAHRTAEPFRLPSRLEIRLVSAPAFLGTKIEALANRGGGDFLASHDLEDIVAVVDGRDSLLDELAVADPELRRYVGRAIGALLDKSSFVEALPGKLPPDPGSQARLPDVVAKLKYLAGGIAD